MSDAALLFEVRGPVAWLTLNRPKAMNSINLEMIAGYEKALPEIVANDAIRVLVVTGNGSAFCAGADLKEALGRTDLPPGEPSFFDRVRAVFETLRNLKKPVIIALNGMTMAGGLETAMCGDIVVAAQSARIGDAHANFGVYPGGGGASVLPRLIPQNVANYLLFTGKTLTAAEMKGYGFVNEVVADAELQAFTQKLAEDIAGKSPIGLRRMKEVARTALDKSRDDGLRHDLLQMYDHLRSYDLAEGLKAFSEKRKPEFKGR